jgi:hypothetical protein
MQAFDSHFSAYRLDEEGQIRSVSDWQLRRRLQRRLAALSRRVNAALAIESHHVDSNLIDALDDFIRRVQGAKIRELYDEEIVPDYSEAEQARHDALIRLSYLRQTWKDNLPTQSFNPRNAALYSKMSIAAILN